MLTVFQIMNVIKIKLGRESIFSLCEEYIFVCVCVYLFIHVNTGIDAYVNGVQ